MSKSKFLTDEQVEAEITRLTKSPYVNLARQEERIRYQRRQYLYRLRGLEKKGKELFKLVSEGEMEGFSLEMFEGNFDEELI